MLLCGLLCPASSSTRTGTRCPEEVSTTAGLISSQAGTSTHTLINAVLENTTGIATLESANTSAPRSMAAYEAFSSPLGSCAACQVLIREQLENSCYAQGILVQHQASLATKLVQLRTLSRAMLHHLLDAENNASPGVTLPSMAVPQGRPRGTKRYRPEHYSAGP